MRSPPLWLLLAVQGTVSAASLVVEIVAGRMLAPYVGMSLYTWTSVIAVVLAGFSVGHWWGGVLAERDRVGALRAMGWSMLAAALSTGIALILLQGIAEPILKMIGHPVWGIAVLATAVFFLPSCFAGIPAPILARIAVEDSSQSGRALGAIFAVGAVGAIAGTLLAGFLFISWLGTAATLAVVTLVYVAAALASFAMAGGRDIALPLLAGIIALALSGYAMAAPNPCTLESRYFCIRSIDMSSDPASPVQLMVIDHLATA